MGKKAWEEKNQRCGIEIRPDTIKTPMDFSDEEWIDFCKRCQIYNINPIPKNGIIDAIINLTIEEMVKDEKLPLHLSKIT